jgi:hypothetical protein
MEKSYRLTSLFFVLILFVVLWGFYRTYFSFFPNFSGFQTAQHFHGIMMMLWLLMLIVQPLLILSGRTSWHRVLGKTSYVIAPLVALSIYLVTRMSYYKLLPEAGEIPAIGSGALQFPLMIAFLLFWGLAIRNRRVTPVHMRYMIGTSVLMIGPGLGRALIIYFGYPFDTAVNIVNYLAMAIIAVLMIIDLARKKSFSTYLTILITLICCHLIFIFRAGSFWQTVGGWIARNLY